jgi:uncharacterized protein YjbK
MHFTIRIDYLPKLCSRVGELTFNLNNANLEVVRSKPTGNWNFRVDKHKLDLDTILAYITEDIFMDNFNAQSFLKMLDKLGPVRGSTGIESKLIALDRNFAFVKNIGIYSLIEFESNEKYVLNTQFVTLIKTLTRSVDTTNLLQLKTLENGDYIMVKLGMDILVGRAVRTNMELRLSNALKPTKGLEVDKAELVQVLDEIEVHEDSVVTLGMEQNQIRLKSKSVEGDAESCLDARPFVPNCTFDDRYRINTKYLRQLLKGVGTKTVIICTATSDEHLMFVDGEGYTKHILLVG